MLRSEEWWWGVCVCERERERERERETLLGFGRSSANVVNEEDSERGRATLV